LRPFVADDGVIIRLKIPGGRVSVATLASLLDVAVDAGAPVLQLTSRAGIQLRALPNPLPEWVAERIEQTGLLPSASHERVRNILASPLAPDLDLLVRALDSGLCADPWLADLPGRFLFAIADSTGSVLSEPFDIGYQALDADRGLLLVDSPRGRLAAEVATAAAATQMLVRARAFIDARDGLPAAHPPVWNTRDLPGESRVFAGLRTEELTVAEPLPPGPAGDDLVVGVPLGMLRLEHHEAIAQYSDEVRVTPWRSLVVAHPGPGAAETLAEVGLAVSASSPWASLSACVGAPYCARTASPTLALTRQAAQQLSAGGRVHVAGCERACGHPRTPHTVVLAPSTVGEIVQAAQ
jgi:precorrin-3B synthase